MSDITPGPEYTEPLDLTGPPSGRGRRFATIGAVLVVVLALVGGAAYAAYSFLNGGGPRPADALPSSTVAFVSIDLNPHAGQKIEAIKTLRKFPALRKRLGLDSKDDLRRYIVDKGLDQACHGIDYDRDVKPWIGERAAFAGVDLGGKYPAPAIVLQVSDAAKATKDFAKIADCAGSDFGYAVGKDYLIASDSTAHAQQIVTAGEKSPLADDATYQRWDDEAGDGVAKFYIAPRVTKYLQSLMHELNPTSRDKLTAGVAGAAAPRTAAGPLTRITDVFKDFKGAAGSLRFAGGGMELSVVSDAGKQKLGDSIGPVLGRLPTDTALALGISVPKGFGTTALDEAKSRLGEAEVQQFLDQAHTRTGLTLPGDAEDLLGTAVTFSVGGNAPTSASAFDDPTKLPAGMALHGDPQKSLAVLHKLERSLGFRLSDSPVVTKTSGDALLLSTSTDYLDQLDQKGSLGSNKVFTKAVPDADHAGLVLYVVIDAGWRKAIVDLASNDLSASQSRQIADNLAPFQALGLSSVVDNGVSRFDLRITTR